MGKLTFNYGAMNSGKTALLIQAAYNYEERDQNVLIIKASIDTKGHDTIISRIGLSRKVDILINPTDSVIDKYRDLFIKNKNINNEYKVDCILVDEAQFLTTNQVTELWRLCKIKDIPIICYGLRTDFQTNAFPGSLRLMELSDRLKELPTICRCGAMARFNGRIINGQFVSEGSQVAIDKTDNITYESLCGKCYLEKVGYQKIIR